MPRTPDEFPGERIEDGILFISQSSPVAQTGEMKYVDGVGFQFYDIDGIKVLTPAGSGSLSSGSHATIKQLIHFLNDGPGDSFSVSPFKETVGVPFISRETWWESSAKINRIFQTEVTRSGILPITESFKLYSQDGFTVSARALDVITYSNGVFEDTRTRTFFIT